MLGLILDHNGVICEGKDFYKERSKRVAKILNIKCSEEFMHYWKKIYIEASLGKISLEEYYRKIADAFSLKLNGNEDDLFIGMEKLIPEIAEVLREIRKNKSVKIALISNYVNRWVQKFLEAKKLRKFFHAVIVSSSIGVRKPEPEAFKLTARAIDTPLQNCIYVGDTIIDLESCRKIGIRAIFIPGEEKEPNGFEMIKSVRELVKVVKQYNI